MDFISLSSFVRQETASEKAIVFIIISLFYRRLSTYRLTYIIMPNERFLFNYRIVFRCENSTFME